MFGTEVLLFIYHNQNDISSAGQVVYNLDKFILKLPENAGTPAGCLGCRMVICFSENCCGQIAFI